MKTFEELHALHSWEETTASIYNKTAADVEQALIASNPGLEDFKALISPAAEAYLEQMAVKSRAITQRRFGKTIQMYIPLYLSNACANACAYCGFSHDNDIKRITLSKEQVLEEIAVIKDMGFQHLLLVTGEHPKDCGYDYLKEMVELVKPHFPSLSIEVQPMKQEEYEGLIDTGLHTVYVYQETYHKDNYTSYHPRGKKSDFSYRLATPERLGKAHIHKIGIGCLLGLEDWRTDSFFTALHLNYLEKNFWRTKYSISFPRLRPHVGSFQPNVDVNDKQLAQLIMAYRIFNPDVDLSLSTRESKKFRNNMLQLGVTAMSAGSKTEPGGYAVYNKALEQFSVNDDRSPADMCQMIKEGGYEPVWKDWDACMQ
ncbi:2-iminoacetate synthase ThiH [Carboxylicivirga sp. M1479]|uniref:2-iminoacetate synthase ThiH n=1 Tax=Carboxylicivirga sp. M1479 TaxID=2594476 RepID=UPI001177E00E|nr:2-iminoacetate synthase ThiH [Carboxylicivirga sp. M1479]TRX66120.1 2-iminoacetate synthase ThiH [Carboxylicivirga sp. M1479]